MRRTPDSRKDGSAEWVNRKRRGSYRGWAKNRLRRIGPSPSRPANPMGGEEMGPPTIAEFNDMPIGGDKSVSIYSRAPFARAKWRTQFPGKGPQLGESSGGSSDS